jgi:hypothetical protein
MIFVGGYCSNDILLNLIKNGTNKITTYLQPSNPSLAIMEGAVLFGIQPSTINIRKAKYTIGKGIGVPWNDELHSGKGKKIYIKEFKKWFCNNCFKKYIEINQNLKIDEVISHTDYSLDFYSEISFYKTKKQNPIFTFEEGIKKIGECKFYIDNEYKKINDREIKTIMKFGGTFIDVTAIHLKSGKTVKTKLTFD